MNKPELHDKYGRQAVNETKKILQNFIHLIKTPKYGKKSAIDIGSGTGKVTKNILFPLLEDSVDELLGIDSNELMVQYAKNNYFHSQISFRTHNIMNNIPREFVKSFDHVFSFWTFHWIKDHKNLFKSINKLLKPGGNMLVSFVASSELFDIYKTVWKREPWQKYITDAAKGCSIYQNCDQPIEKVSKYVTGAGCDVQLCTTVQIDYLYENLEEVKGLLQSLIPVYDEIPEELRKQFLEEHVKEVAIIDNNFVTDINLFVICATKSSTYQVSDLQD
ncbi:hypothetical protein FQA39_LY03772 [Lamprigera yunnana]|nr:hypothetical protein FQA39_LY03772 [Lamprigera yunnana]